MVIAGVGTSFGEVQHECGSASVQTQNKKSSTWRLDVFWWCVVVWLPLVASKRNSQGFVSPTAGVAERSTESDINVDLVTLTKKHGLREAHL